MELTNHQIIIALMATAFNTYVVYKFMRVFFTSGSKNRCREISSYILYYIVNNVVCIYIGDAKWIVTSSLLMLYAITTQYHSTSSKRFIATVIIFVVGALTEAIAINALQWLGYPHPYYYSDGEYAISRAAIGIVYYMVVMLLFNYRLTQHDEKIPRLYWLAIVFVPLGTLFSTIVFIVTVPQVEMYLIVMSIGILFAINILIFYLYDYLLKSYQDQIDKELLLHQNRAYTKQLEIMLDANEQIRALRHDFAHHLQALKALIDHDEQEAALAYMGRMERAAFGDATLHANTGNVIVDSILNQKLSRAKQSGILLAYQIDLPEKLKVAPFDLSVILGNLLDNALEAVAKVAEARAIRLDITYDRGLIYLTLSNPLPPESRPLAQGLQTSKGDKENHGLGLRSVQRALAQYPGSHMSLQDEGGQFTVNIILKDLYPKPETF